MYKILFIFSLLLIGIILMNPFRGKKTYNSGLSQTIKIYDYKHNKVIAVDKIIKSDSDWKKILTPEQYETTTKHGTEHPGTCLFDNIKEEGVYKCIRCDTDILLSKAKFESGTGWPSFFEPVSGLNIQIKPDYSYGMIRNEVLCARCDSHLGHVFNDGPPPTGKRYCINGTALRFDKAQLRKSENALFAAGCFWHVEDIFRNINGVTKTTVGYSGGTTENPDYKDVCTGTTGHVETVLITYDPSIISYENLLDIFWKIHDPTALNRQGPDIGTQYRSVIFYYNKEQESAAIKSKKKLEKSSIYKSPIVTEIIPASNFYRAEEYHQCYLEKQRTR